MMRSSFTNIGTLLQKKVKISPKLEFLLRFDGCSKGNPGLSGSGAVIYQNEIEIWSDSKFVGYKETNNYAEYMGLIMGLNKAIELNISELHVEGDSMLVIKQMTGKNKVNSPNLIELNKLAMKLKSKFNIITFEHIYRDKNTRADELCNEAINFCLSNTRVI
jgi:ribonuclease HI